MAGALSGVEVRIPGKIMLAGEYSILAGGSCLAATVNAAMKVGIHHLDGGIEVSSEFWGATRTFADHADLVAAAQREPLLAVLAEALTPFRGAYRGIAVDVDKGIDVTSGFGSSSALSLGVFVGVSKLLDPAFAPGHVLEYCAPRAIAWQRKRQAMASGYDVVTQCTGGVVEISPQHADGSTQALPAFSSLAPEREALATIQVMVGPEGNATAATIAPTFSWLRSGNRWQIFQQTMTNLTTCFSRYFMGRESLSNLVALTAAARKVMEGSPDFPSEVLLALQQLAGFDERWSFKTTGAGGRDAMLLVGEVHELKSPGAALAALGWRHIDDWYSCDSLTWSEAAPRHIGQGKILQ